MKPADYGSNFQTTYDSMNSAADRNRKKVSQNTERLVNKICLFEILNHFLLANIVETTCIYF